MFLSSWRLARALTVSVLAHAGLLFGVTGILPGRADAPVVPVISVVAMNRAVSGTPSAEPSPAPEKPASALKEPERSDAPVPPRIRKPAARRLAVPNPRAEVPSVPETAPASSSVLQSDDGISSGETARPSDAPTASSASFASSASSGVAGVSADDVRQYRLALWENAERFKRYPPLARERGWEGTVEIALDFRHSGDEPVLLLTGPSGKKIFDEQALETLRRAVRQTGLPDGLKGKDFRVPPLAITFRLEN